MQEFKLPDLGEGMQEAEVVEWLVKAGDTLKLDQTMVKVETDKAVVEIPSPVAGRIAEIRVQLLQMEVAQRLLRDSHLDHRLLNQQTYQLLILYPRTRLQSSVSLQPLLCVSWPSNSA